MDLGSGSGASAIVIFRLLVYLLSLDFPYAGDGGGEGSGVGGEAFSTPNSLLVYNLRLRGFAYHGQYCGNA
jgi:hypothetical protein